VYTMYATNVLVYVGFWKFGERKLDNDCEHCTREMPKKMRFPTFLFCSLVRERFASVHLAPTV